MGLIIVYETHKEHKSGMAGTYRANPTEALKVASLGLQHLYSYEARKRCDPLTASDIFMSNR